MVVVVVVVEAVVCSDSNLYIQYLANAKEAANDASSDDTPEFLDVHGSARSSWRRRVIISMNERCILWK